MENIGILKDSDEDGATSAFLTVAALKKMGEQRRKEREEKELTRQFMNRIGRTTREYNLQIERKENKNV